MPALRSRSIHRMLPERPHYAPSVLPLAPSICGSVSFFWKDIR